MASVLYGLVWVAQQRVRLGENPVDGSAMVSVALLLQHRVGETDGQL
jgi:hypothetical protein